MIKTDKVIYRARTREEYDWLMEKLDEAWCEWRSRSKLFDLNLFFEYSPYFAVRLKNKKASYSVLDSYTNNRNYKYYDFIEVSDLMETEKETDAQNKLDAIHKQVTNQIEDLRKQGKEPKAIEYTIRVCFE